MFRDYVFGKRKVLFEKPIYNGNLQEYKHGLCPVAEEVQPKMLQFKTNYWDLEIGKEKIEALAKTIEFINKL